MPTTIHALAVQSRANGHHVSAVRTIPGGVTAIDLMTVGGGYSDPAMHIGFAAFWSPTGTAIKGYIANAATDVLTSPSHGFSNGNTVTLQNDLGAPPAPLQVGTTYFVVSAAANTLKLALTSGGAAINLTDNGTGYNQFVQDWAFQAGTALENTHGGRTFSIDVAQSRLLSKAHGLANGASFQLKNVGGSLPSPLTIGTTYFVVNTTTDSIQLSLTSGGAAITLLNAGVGECVGIVDCPTGFRNMPMQTGGFYQAVLFVSGGPITFGLDLTEYP